MKEVVKIVLKGQKYATPMTESVVVENQGVLCGSGLVTVGSSIKTLVTGSSGTGGSIKSWN